MKSNSTFQLTRSSLAHQPVVGIGGNCNCSNGKKSAWGGGSNIESAGSLKIEGVYAANFLITVSEMDLPVLNLLKFDYREGSMHRTNYYVPAIEVEEQLRTSRVRRKKFELFEVQPHLAIKDTGEEFLIYVRTGDNVANNSRRAVIECAQGNWVKISGGTQVRATVRPKTKLLPNFRKGSPEDILLEGLADSVIYDVSQLDEIEEAHNARKVILLKESIRGRRA